MSDRVAWECPSCKALLTETVVGTELPELALCNECGRWAGITRDTGLPGWRRGVWRADDEEEETDDLVDAGRQPGVADGDDGGDAGVDHEAGEPYSIP